MNDRLVVEETERSDDKDGAVIKKKRKIECSGKIG